MEAKKGDMPGFILVMYSTVLAVAFYRIEIPGGSTRVTLSFNWQDLCAFMTDLRTFRFFLFAFTLIILAHDWHAYHHLMPSRDKSFWNFMPQIMSLFFISQMFVVIQGDNDAGNFQYWFIFAFWHTWGNILNYMVINGGCSLFRSHYTQGIKFFIHLVLCSVFFFVLDNVYHPCCYYCALSFTAVSVFLLWCFFPLKDPKNTTDSNLKETCIE